jgi:hypothetical protein
MSSKVAIDRPIGIAALNGLVRVALVTVGAATVAWATVMRMTGSGPALDRIAARIIGGEQYEAEELDQLGPALDAVSAARWSRAASLRAAAIIELRQAETAIAAGRRDVIDDRMNALGRALHRALTVAPSDPFLWLVLFWQQTTVDGFDAKRLPLLAASYRLGPNEGWIGVRRSALALALFSRLPPDLAERVVAEFVGLVNSGFPEMAQILVGPGWGARDILLPRLAAADKVRRKAFSRAVYRHGYDVTVPGIDRPDDRPWSR